MNCDMIRSKINLTLTGESFALDAEITAHLETCPACAVYHAELSQLRGTLNEQVFEVRPGELDDITFESVAGGSKKSKKLTGFSRIVVSSFRRWAWAPAVAAAIILYFAYTPKHVVINGDEAAITSRDSYNWILSDLTDGAWSSVVDVFIEDETEFDYVADEIPLDLEDALESMTDEELKILYDRIDNLNGSVS